MHIVITIPITNLLLPKLTKTIVDNNCYRNLSEKQCNFIKILK